MSIKQNLVPISKRTSHELAQDTKKTREASEMVNDFISNFRAKFGVSARVSYSFTPIKYNITLQQLIKIIDILINEDIYIKSKVSVKTKTRKREIVLYRQCAFRIAVELGYGPSITAEAFGFDHATIIHSNKVIQSLIDTRNKQAINILNNIENELKTRYGIVGNVQLNDEGGDNA